jgi:hypothetical protein
MNPETGDQTQAGQLYNDTPVPMAAVIAACGSGSQAETDDARPLQ